MIRVVKEGQARRDLQTGDGADGEVTYTCLSTATVSPLRVVMHCLNRVLDVEPEASQLPRPPLIPRAQARPFPPQRRCGCQLRREGAKRACTFLLRSAKQATGALLRSAVLDM